MRSNTRRVLVRGDNARLTRFFERMRARACYHDRYRLVDVRVFNDSTPTRPERRRWCVTYAMRSSTA